MGEIVNTGLPKLDVEVFNDIHFEAKENTSELKESLVLTIDYLDLAEKSLQTLVGQTKTMMEKTLSRQMHGELYDRLRNYERLLESIRLVELPDVDLVSVVEDECF